MHDTSGPLDVSVILPTHNRSDSLHRTLARLAMQQFEGTWELIVVNNQGVDDTDAVVMAMPFPVAVRLLHEAGPGAAAARNCGLRAARGATTVFLDDDILAPVDMLAHFTEDLAADDGVWVLGQTQHPPLDTAPTVFERYRRAMCTLLPADAGLTTVDSFASGIAALPTEDLRVLGGYNERYPGASLEDADLYVRACRLGRRVVVDPVVVAVHDDWASESLEAFCLRQRLYARTAPLLALEFGNENPRRELVDRNRRATTTDPLRTRIAKRARSLLATRAGQFSCFAAAHLIERSGIGTHRVYPFVAKAAIAGSMYCGMQEGMAEHGVGPADLRGQP